MGYIYEAIQRAQQHATPATAPSQYAPVNPAETPLSSVLMPLGDSHGQADILGSVDSAVEELSLSTAPPSFVQTNITKMDDRLVILTNPAHVIAEEYRSIRTGLLARHQNRRHLVHTITSSTPQEGKTLTSLNLGLSFAELRNRRTIVLEADLRLPRLAELLNLPDTPGLVELLEGKADLSQCLAGVGDPALHLIPAGRRVSNEAVQLLSSPTMAALLHALRRRYDHVIIDTPPVLELADAGILGTQSDDMLLVVRMTHTPRTLVEQAIRILGSYNASITGFIATDQPPHSGYYHKYGYPYTNRGHPRSG